MNEDIAALFRLGVEITLLAAISTAVVTFFVVGMTTLNDFVTEVSATTGYMQQNSIYQANGKAISAPGCFRICDANAGIFNTISIRLMDGTTFTDINVLLQNTNETRVFVFEAIRRDDSLWDLVLREVD